MNLKTKLAATLLKLDRLWDYEASKRLSAADIIACYEFDHHPIRKADGGPDEPWNVTPRLKAEHRAKTKRDLAEMAKGKRIRRKWAEHRERIKSK